MLSDPDSAVIRSFGILNTLIDPDDHPWFGIPYPGSYVVGADGAITHKFFENNLAVRPGPEQLLRAVLGEPMLEARVDAAAPEAVEVSIVLDGDSLAATVQRDLVVQFRVPAGRHVYAQPAPQGTIAVDVVLAENESVVERPLVRPPSELHTLAGTGESFQVHHGSFELRLPLTINNAARIDTAGVTISGEIRWQSCDDEMCDLPMGQRFERTLPVAESPPVALRGNQGLALEPNAGRHFQRMSERRLRGPTGKTTSSPPNGEPTG